MLFSYKLVVSRSSLVSPFPSSHHTAGHPLRVIRVQICSDISIRGNYNWTALNTRQGNNTVKSDIIIVTAEIGSTDASRPFSIHRHGHRSRTNGCQAYPPPTPHTHKHTHTITATHTAQILSWVA